MNPRVAAHMLAAVSTALAGGTIVFAGLSDIVTKDISSISALVSICVSIYLASTTTGVAK